MRNVIYRNAIQLRGKTQDDRTVIRDLICKEGEDPVILGMRMFPELRRCVYVHVKRTKAMPPRPIAIYEHKTREEIREYAEEYIARAARDRGIRLADWYRGEKPGPISYMPRFSVEEE